MKKTWDKIFSRRKSIAERELQDDYPDSDSDDVTDDERRQLEWQAHLNRRATIAESSQPVKDADDETSEGQWEYESEYSVTFPSDSSIIDAFKEEDFPVDACKFEKDVEQFKHQLERKRAGLGHSKSNKRENTQSHGKPNGEKRLIIKDHGCTRYPTVRERISNFEAGKRRQSCIPRSESSANRRGDTERCATWNEASGKSKTRKHQRRRKRSRRISSDEEEGPYMVNLTMEDLNHIIKKNVSSAVKTIVSAASKNGAKLTKKKLSLTDSISTETETIFSGSSSHSTEIPAGLLQKQIKAQLDKDLLRGARKSSDDNVRHSTAAQATTFQHNVSTLPVPLVKENPPSPFLRPRHHEINQYYNSQQQPQATLAQAINATPPPPPPPPPLPPALSPASPQVTFNLPTTDYRRPSLCLGHFNDFLDLPGSFNGRMGGAQDISGNPYCAISPAPNRLRRHTLAAIDNEDLLTDINNSMEQKLEQFTNALQKLNRQGQETANSSDSAKTPDKANPEPSNEVKIQETPNDLFRSLANPLAPVLSIADQIAALSKKKKEPLKPGQIRMSGCVRALLVLTNIVFLMSGSGVVALGVWMMMDPNIETYFNVLNVDQKSDSFTTICYVLLAVGGFVVFVAFTGCCGGIKSNKCMLTVFLVIVAVITIAEAGLGCLIILNLDSPTTIPILSAIYSDVEENLKTMLKQSIVHKYLPDTLIGTTWDSLQIKLECCGATGPIDYAKSAWKNDSLNDLTIPDTCCTLVSKNAPEPDPSNKLLCQAETLGFYHDVVFSFIFALVICRRSCKEEEKMKAKQLT